MSTPDAQQLGFDGLLADAEAHNRERELARETAHLPEEMSEALPLYRAMTLRHHEAMFAADVKEAMRLRDSKFHTVLSFTNLAFAK